MGIRSLQMMAWRAVLLVPWLAWSPLPSMADDAARQDDDAGVDFLTQINPILASRCIGCHGPDLQEGGLRLDTRERAFAGGESGKILDFDDVPASLLLRRITGRGERPRMPLDEEPLSADQIELISRWIRHGAVWPESDTPESGAAEHWAYQKPQRPPVPAIDPNRGAWVQTPVDAFVLEHSHAEGVVPSPPADHARLLRRVYLDLIGLPPTIEQLDALLGDNSLGAWENVVDGLLASPRFGEHWARAWLDQARYADSNGYQADQYRNVWPYRDWVIQAMNDDMPFDQFTIEQLAGDLLPSPTLSQKIATGFHRLTTCNVEAGVDPEENRVNQVVDRVNTTATVWLGTTLACAQCHSHKYDPFSQREYYRLFAYFNNTPIEVSGDGVTFNFIGPKMELPLAAADQERRDRLRTRRDERQGELQAAIATAKSAQAQWEVEAVAGDVPEKIANLLNIPGENRNKQQAAQVTEFFLGRRPDVKSARQRLATVEKKLEALTPVTTLVMVEDDQPRQTAILRRGSFLDPGEEVNPGTPAALHSADHDLPANRLGLARWLAEKNNPLTARVTVNRWWAALFGRGLVTTLEDFGTQGAAPTHPELLDWLACELIDSGWSRKHVLKTIVMTSTYRQSSRLTPELLARDPGNALYARGARVRLPAETIRDNALAASGLLTHQLGGPPVYPPQPDGVWRHVGRNAPKYAVSTGGDRFRRGIYVVWRRSAPYASFTNFDAPDRASCTVARPTTNTPLQALTLLNDPAYVEMARALAARMAGDEAGATIDERIIYGFRLCVARVPDAVEMETLRELYQRQRSRFQQSPDDASEMLGQAADGQFESAELAAWFLVANALLNLDETLTKG